MSRASASPSVPERSGSRGGHALPRAPSVLVGRDEQLERLERCFARVSLAAVYGTPGLGKTALASAFAAIQKRPVWYERVSQPDLGILLDDMRRLFTPGDIVEVDTYAARFDIVASAVDSADALWIVDDLHNLSVADRATFVEELGNRLRVGRVLVTSRERIIVDAAGPDRCDIHLEPVDREAAWTLWRELDELYGPVEGFEAAYAASQGSPLHLRRAHAGTFAAEGQSRPLAAWVGSLSTEARALANILAITRIAVPEQALLAHLGSSGQRALEELVRRFLVEINGEGACRMLDMFRDAVREGWSEPEASRHHGDAASVVDSDALEPVVRVREVTHHLLASHRYGDVCTLLEQNAEHVTERGAASELLRWIERIPPASRTTAVELSRAFCMIRLGFVERGYQCLRALADSLPAPEVEVELSFAQSETLTGRLLDARKRLQRVIDLARLTPKQAARARRMLAVVLSQTGEADLARQILDELGRGAKTERERCLLAFVRAFSYWAEGRYAEAEEPMVEARALYDSGVRNWRRMRLYITWAPMLVNLGRHQEAEQAIVEALGGATVDDESVPIGLRVERAIVVSERGERAEAIRLLEDAIAAEGKRGMRLSVWWAQLQLGRNLLLCGRRKEGLRVLDETDLTATPAGAVAVLNATRFERKLDPLPLLKAGPEALIGTNKGFPMRRELLEALHAVRNGNVRRAQSRLDRIGDGIDARPGYGLDRVIAHTTRAAIAKLTGHHDAVARHLRLAYQSGFDERVDADVLEAVVDFVGLADGEPLPVSPSPAVLDTNRHVLRFEGKEVSVAGRPVVRKFLYLLAENANQEVSKDRIVRSVWDCDYDPRRHDNPIRVTVRRIRTLLEGGPLRVTTEATGYRLVAREGLLLEGVGTPSNSL